MYQTVIGANTKAAIESTANEFMKIYRERVRLSHVPTIPVIIIRLITMRIIQATITAEIDK
jgi:hypothetical protein